MILLRQLWHGCLFNLTLCLEVKVTEKIDLDRLHTEQTDRQIHLLIKFIVVWGQPLVESYSSCQEWFIIVDNLSHLINDLFTNCQKSDDLSISNPYYPSIAEKINTIGQLLTKLQRRTSLTYRENKHTDRQTDGDDDPLYIKKKYTHFTTNETTYLHGWV